MAIGFNILQQLQTGRATLDGVIAGLGRSTPHVIVNESKLALELKTAGYFVLYRHQFEDDREYRNFDAYQRTSRARPAGAQMVVVNASVGTPHEDLITREPAIKLLLQAISRSGDILGLHEYSPQLEDSDARQIRPWFLGRYRFWIDRAHKEGIVPPRVIITEFGYDVGGGNDDGWQGHKSITEDEYAALIAAQANEYRRAGYEVDACLFGYGGGFNWESFNVERSTRILSALTSANLAAPAQPAPPPVTGNLTDWKDAKLTPTDSQRGVNMRSTPDVGARVPYAFPGGKTYDVGYDPTQDTPDKSKTTLTWRRVQYGALRGWVRSDAANVELVKVEPEPEPTPEPTPDPTPEPDPIPLPDFNADLKRNLLYEFKVMEIAMGNARRIMAQMWGIDADAASATVAEPVSRNEAGV